MLMSTIGVLIALVIIIILAYKGITPVLTAPLVCIIICIMAGINVVDGYVTHYATGFANLTKSFLPIFLSCTIFGEAMNQTKSSHSIAYWLADKIGCNYAATACYIITVALAAGGMNMGVYVIVGPIGGILLSKGGYSKDILLACIMAGFWTFTAGAPYMPHPYNQLCMNALGTPSNAGLIPGGAAAIFMMIVSGIYLEWQSRRWKKQGRVWNESETAAHLDFAKERESCPSLIVSIIPLLVVLLVFNVANIALPGAMICGAIVCTLLNLKRLSPWEWLKCWEKGAVNCVHPVACIAAMGGIAGVVRETAMFSGVVEWMGSTTLHPYVLALLGTNVMAGLLGSGSASLGVVLPEVAPIYQAAAATGNYAIGNLHRLTSLGTIALDSLPQNGSIIAAMEIIGTNHKKAYAPVFITTVLLPLVAGFCVALPLAMAGFQ